VQGLQIVNLELPDLALAYGLVLLAAGLARLRHNGQEWKILWASLRMVVQLLAMGYLLHFVFAIKSPLPVLAILLVMGGFSLQVMGGHVKQKMPHFYRVVSCAIFIGCGGATFLFCSVIVGNTPWWDPRYLIPMAGMIIGNSMNGASLAAERLCSEMSGRREEMEAALCLGASSRQAAEAALGQAFRAALMTNVNNMAAMGVVMLPGMMTGQILAGIEPVVAVRYQIAIMCAITGSVSVTSYLILILGYRHYFSDAHQLKMGEA